MKRYLAVLLILVSVPLWSQSPTRRDARQMNLRMLNVLDEYIRTSSLSDTRDRQAFMRLFEEQESPSLFNDLLGTSSYMEYVTPQQYVESIGTDGNGSILRTEISEVRKNGDFFISDGKWHRKLLIRKYVMHIDASVYTGDAGGVLFDSEQLLDDRSDYLLGIDFVFDEEEGGCRIQKISLEGGMPSSILNKKEFFVVLKPDELYEDRIYSAGQNIRFNDFGQAIVTDLSTLRVNDGDVVLKTSSIANSSNYSVINLAFKHYHFRLKPRYGMSFGDEAFGFSTKPDVKFSSTSKASELGLDIGLSFRLNDFGRLILYTGGAYSTSSVSMKAVDFSYSFATFDTGGIKYDRLYQIQEASEELAFKEIMIPAYIETEFSLGRRAMLSLDLGAKVYLCLDNSTSPFHVMGQTSSTQNVSASLGSFSNDFFSNDFTQFIAPAPYGKESYDVSVFAGGEFDINPFGTQVPIYLFASASYEYGVLPAFKSAESPFLEENIYPVVFADGKENAFHSFVDCVSFYRRSPWLSFGLKIKL